MRYTIEEFINILNKFPKDLKIETELALMGEKGTSTSSVSIYDIKASKL